MTIKLATFEGSKGRIVGTSAGLSAALIGGFFVLQGSLLQSLVGVLFVVEGVYELGYLLL